MASRRRGRTAGPTTETEIDEQRGIRKGIIDEPRLHEPSHVVPLLVRSARYLIVEKKTPKMPPRPRRGRFVYGRRSPNSFRTPSHSRSGLRSPALASSMIRLAMISL